MVGSGTWRAGLGPPKFVFPVGSLFRLRVSHHLGRATFSSSPPRRTQHADFSHCALLFASPQGLWDLSCRSGFRHWSNHSVAIKQLQSLVQPSPTPPRPAEAFVGSGVLRSKWRRIFFSTQSSHEAEALRWRVPPQSNSPNPRSTGLINFTTRSTGCDWWQRNTSLSLRSKRRPLF